MFIQVLPNFVELANGLSLPWALNQQVSHAVVSRPDSRRFN
jgi:hypothetical protein